MRLLAIMGPLLDGRLGRTGPHEWDLIVDPSVCSKLFVPRGNIHP